MPRSIANHELDALIAESGLSHAALARQVVHLGATEHGLRLAYDYRSIGRWLKGAVPDPPSPVLLAQVLSRALGRALTVHQLGFHHGDKIRQSLSISARPAATVNAVTELWRSAVERRAFMHHSVTFIAAAAIEAALDWRDAPAQTPLTRTEGARAATDADIDRLRQATREFRQLDHAHGGGYALSWLEQYLTTEVDPLLQGSYSDSLGRELFNVSATLTDMAGWMAMDAGHQGLAQYYYTQAAALAKHSGDTAYGAYVLGNLATQALVLGETRTAVRLARSARDTGGRAIPATLTARITVTEARAHALIGDSHETRHTLRVADRAMERSAPDQDPEWLGAFSPAHYCGSVMHALRDLGDTDAAEQQASAALDLPARNARTRALHGVLHASVLIQRGDLDGAVEAASPIQQDAAGIKSSRLNLRLAELAEQFAPHRGVSVIADYLEADRHR
ncbi:hypothetical protein [Streptosporangium sp. CA-115845]|uniref:hypothetical protein n=1 Tax=Streptosporangium sp. CA-115845 TaxID=3240071 RepID=UPI003D8E51E3